MISWISEQLSKLPARTFILLGCDLNDDMGTCKEQGALHRIQSTAIGDMGLKEEGFGATAFR